MRNILPAIASFSRAAFALVKFYVRPRENP